MGIKRIVDTKFWTDEKILDNYSAEDRYFLLYLMTNPHTSQVGIYKLPKKIMGFEIGYSKECIETLLTRFSDQYKNILYCNETQEISILNYLKYSIVKGGKPVEDLLIKELSLIENTDLILQTFSHMMSFWDKSVRDFDQSIKNIFMDELLKRKVAKEKLNDNDNDNDNEESLANRGRIVEKLNPTIKEQDTKPLPKKTKHKYGQYKNVLLTDEDLEKLKIEFSDWSERIERLSEYMASKGEAYKNHLATIRSWSRREQKIIPKEPQTIQQLLKGIVKNDG